MVKKYDLNINPGKESNMGFLSRIAYRNLPFVRRLELGTDDHSERNQERTPGHAGRRYNPEVAGREMEDLC